MVDEISLELIDGSKVDYTMELIGSEFKVVDNPRAVSKCGCDTSIDIDIGKKLSPDYIVPSNRIKAKRLKKINDNLILLVYDGYGL